MKHAAPKSGLKLNVKRTFLVGFAFMLISLFWQTYDGIVAKMLINDFGLNQTGSGIVLALDNIIALFLLPLFGTWSDRTRSRFGKRTPYIFIGTIIAAIVLVGLGAVDFFQQQVIVGNGVTGVLSRDIGGVTQYYYQVGGVDAHVNAIKDLVATHRSAYIYEQITVNNVGYLVGFIGILLIVLVAMSSFRTPAVSLMPDVTIKPLRSKANAVINLMGTFGGVVALLAAQFLAKDYNSYIPIFALTGGLMLVLLAVFMLFVKERPWQKEMQDDSVRLGIETSEDVDQANAGKKEKLSKEVRKSFILILASVVLWFMAYNAATSKFSDYATNVLDLSSWAMALLVAQGAAIVSFYPVGLIATKIGRKKTILIGISILVVAFILGAIANPSTQVLIYVTMALAGVGWATINVNSYPMVVEMGSGSNIGVYTGYYYTASMAAQIATPIVSGILMDVLDRRILFIYCVVFAAAAFVTMFFVKHGDPKKIEELNVVEDDKKEEPIANE